MPMPALLRYLLIVAGLFGAFLVAAPAGANWNGTKPYRIYIVAGGGSTQEVEDAADVTVQDVMQQITIGETSPTPDAGELTVVGEGSGLDRKILGTWNIDNGTGNVQSVIGTVNVFRVGGGNAEFDLPGVLNILNSDIEGGSTIVYKGSTLNVAGGSNIGHVEVHEDASAYVTLFSRIGNLTTQTDSYARLQESISSSTSYCNQFGTVLIEDSLLRCGNANIWSTGHVEIHPAVTASSTLEITNELHINNQASLSVVGTNATTGSIVMGGDDTDFNIGSSHWTNAGELAFGTSSVVGPVEMTIGAGTRFHNGGTARVAGHPAWQHLTVSGDGTELEIDGDLRIGEYLFHNQAQLFSGNVMVADGATVIVHGELAIQPLGVLNLEPGGTVYATSLDNDGTINENGGTLVLPEAGAAASILAAIGTIAALAARSHERCSCRYFSPS
jgi:hypothetical protein